MVTRLPVPTFRLITAPKHYNGLTTGPSWRTMYHHTLNKLSGTNVDAHSTARHLGYITTPHLCTNFTACYDLCAQSDTTTGIAEAEVRDGLCVSWCCLPHPPVFVRSLQLPPPPLSSLTQNLLIGPTTQTRKIDFWARFVHLCFNNLAIDIAVFRIWNEWNQSETLEYFRGAVPSRAQLWALVLFWFQSCFQSPGLGNGLECNQNVITHNHQPNTNKQQLRPKIT